MALRTNPKINKWFFALYFLFYSNHFKFGPQTEYQSVWISVSIRSNVCLIQGALLLLQEKVPWELFFFCLHLKPNKHYEGFVRIYFCI